MRIIPDRLLITPRRRTTRLRPEVRLFFFRLNSFFLDLLQKIGKTLPSLHDIINDIVHLAEAGANNNNEPHLIEVTLPMLCSYLPVWWRKNLAQRRYAHRHPGSKAASFFPDNEEFLAAALDAEGDSLLDLEIGGGENVDTAGGGENADDDDEEKGWGAATGPITTVTADLMNRVLGSVLQLIQNNIDNRNAPWMTRIASEFPFNWLKLFFLYF